MPKYRLGTDIKIEEDFDPKFWYKNGLFFRPTATTFSVILFTSSLF